MSDEQLQLFDVPEHPANLRRGVAFSLGHATLRHDHAVLLAMTALIVASVVFAFGVERGKRVARAEQRSSLSIAETIPESVVNSPAKLPQKPSKLAAGDSSFAVQVVSYSQAKFAQQELQQLQRQGENAFLLQRQGKMTLLVGPFPTKERADSKLSTLRQRYQGCFIRIL